MAPKRFEVTATTAEARFRDAFHRLRDGCPRLLEPGSKPTQNNVAREAGCDPSALKKSRFPTLVAEIQAFALKHEDNGGEPSVPSPPRNAQVCPKCDSLKDQLRQVTLQRDAAMSALVLADAHMLELAQRVLQLEGTAKNDPDKRLLR
ncbi:hypothetical protein [Xanthomonas pisi]|uniref:hypothetical protein n=1 Tax=Xanthomonas pisi TaxID=56457 RepID=UPI000A4E86DA|nr:hypothetical protein [Xanthomonas pisi]